MPPRAAAEQADLEHDHRAIVDELAASWSVTAGGRLDATDRAMAIDALNQLLHAVSAVLLTGDSRPIPETVAWIADVVTTRGLAASVVDELAGTASAALRNYPLSRAILDTHFADDR